MRLFDKLQELVGGLGFQSLGEPEKHGLVVGASRLEVELAHQLGAFVDEYLRLCRRVVQRLGPAFEVHERIFRHKLLELLEIVVGNGCLAAAALGHGEGIERVDMVETLMLHTRRALAAAVAVGRAPFAVEILHVCPCESIFPRPLRPFEQQGVGDVAAVDESAKPRLHIFVARNVAEFHCFRGGTAVACEATYSRSSLKSRVAKTKSLSALFDAV